MPTFAGLAPLIFETSRQAKFFFLLSNLLSGPLMNIFHNRQMIFYGKKSDPEALYI
jgi:hypothetical protein